MLLLLLILKGLFLFIGVWFSLINLIRTYNKTSIATMNIIWQAIGITGFIYLQWFLI